MSEQADNVPQGTGSLLDNLKAVEKKLENPLTDQPSWNIMEGLPGSGARPDWLLPKYDTMADQAKAYPDLEKKFGSREVAPESYDFGENKDAIDLKNTIIQDYLGFAKQKNLSNEVVSTTIDKFVKYIKSNEPNMDKEIEKLGPDANNKIQTVRQWAENNLSQDACESIGKLASSNPAGIVNLLDEMRQYQYHNSTQIPSGGNQSQPFVKITRKDIEDEMIANYDRIQKDANYRAEITRKFEQAVG